MSVCMYMETHEGPFPSQVFLRRRGTVSNDLERVLVKRERFVCPPQCERRGNRQSVPVH